MATPIESIAKLNDALDGVPFSFAFLGGSVLSLLVTDKAVDAIRVTKDVDVVVDVKNRHEFHAAERLLESRGFKHDTREDAPICRWIYKDVTVDILPIREEVLGWRSKWFGEALSAAKIADCGGRQVNVVSPPYFVALKLEAVEDRGSRDFLYSTDFEDVICLFNGRESIVEEIARDKTLAEPLARKFAEYLKAPELEDAVEGFVQTELDPPKRRAAILERFQSVAALAKRLST